MVLSVAGVDYESLDNDEQQYAVKRLESALKSFGEGFHVYQYLFKTNRPEIPFAHYDDELIDAAIDQRRQYFESKRDRLYEVELFYVIVLEGARSKTGILSALARMPRDPQGAIRELKAQFVAPEQRTLSTFSQIIGELKERLHRWTKEGQYGFLFDNVEDTLSFSKFQTFNFAGWGDAPEVLEPLLFYVLHRASNEIANPAKLATFKTFLLDEAWLFIKNETIRSYIVAAQKTWRKHNAAMILATQSIKELEESGMLAIVAESCPTKIFLANPEMNRQVYREAFHLNDTELDIIADLIPPGEMLIRKAQSSKKVRLNVDSVSYWIATNNARDNLLKREAFAQYGIAEGVRQLAITHPFQPRR
jgi:type IV secretory pathway VirB4 component